MKGAHISFPDFHCPHQHTAATSSSSAQAAELGPPSNPSSGYNLFPLGSLYFCDHCDAIRCPSCVVEEVTTYFCPNCLFEVSSGSVRTEKTRCARNCFLCPVPACTSVLAVTATTTTQNDGSDPASSYVLNCPTCRWTSSELGSRWSFQKSSGIGHQVLDREKHNPETLEFDALQNHFDRYLHTLRTALGNAPGEAIKSDKQASLAALGKRQPSRNTAAAAIAAKLAARKVSESRFFTKTEDKIKPKKPKFLPIPKSEDPPDYSTKRSCMAEADLRLAAMNADEQAEAEPEDEIIARLRAFDGLGQDALDTPAPLTSTWDMPFAQSTSISQLVPERMPLRAKMSKRCTACNHTLIRPESKATSLRWKIKTLASTYIPAIELGNRRKLIDRAGGEGGSVSVRRASGMGTSRGLTEERETLYMPLVKDTTYAYQLAFTNPLLEATKIKLLVRQVQPTSQLKISLQDTSFDLGAFSEPWELEAEAGQAKARNRSAITTRPGRTGVERKGNVTKVPFWAHVGSQAVTSLQFDLDVDFTYQADDVTQPEGASGLPPTQPSDEKPAATIWKTFTFRVRVNLGQVERPGGDV